MGAMSRASTMMCESGSLFVREFLTFRRMLGARSPFHEAGLRLTGENACRTQAPMVVTAEAGRGTLCLTVDASDISHVRQVLGRWMIGPFLVVQIRYLQPSSQGYSIYEARCLKGSSAAPRLERSYATRNGKGLPLLAPTARGSSRAVHRTGASLAGIDWAKARYHGFETCEVVSETFEVTTARWLGFGELSFVRLEGYGTRAVSSGSRKWIQKIFHVRNVVQADDGVWVRTRTNPALQLRRYEAAARSARADDAEFRKPIPQDDLDALLP